MPISPLRIFGNEGRARSPERFVKSDGIRTSVRKLRLCQSALGMSRTRVERLFSAPFSVAWRTMFLRLFFEKGIGTVSQPYKLGGVNQRLSRRHKVARHSHCPLICPRLFRFICPRWGHEASYYVTRWTNCCGSL